MVRSRFAPSPTGFVHIGSLRTALFSYLFARHNGGVNILRVEDTDQNRLVQGALENLVEVLQRMGIEFDEGFYFDPKDRQVKTKGEFGPYLQSERLPIYQKYVQKLLNSQNAYYCYCSSERLEVLRKEQTALKKPPMYDRLCRELTASEREEKLKACLEEGRKPVVRMKIPLEGETRVNDLIYGEITFKHAVLDDQIILKEDGFPTYHLAVVVDDHEMQITHVIRGEEWLPSTPKHLLLYQAFGWTPTEFAHIPLILNPDKSKLSKRQGDVAVESYLNKGYLKEALVNFVAFLGWNPKTEQEIFSKADLIREFDLTKVNKSGAVFDINKLDWINSKYIRATADDKLAEMLIPFWEKEGWISPVIPDSTSESASAGSPEYLYSTSRYALPNLNNSKIDANYLSAIASVEKERLKKLSDITEATNFYFNQPSFDRNLLAWRKSTLEDALQKLAEIREMLENTPEADFKREKLEILFKEFVASRSYDNGSVLWPLRVALTGLEKSAGPFEVLETLILGLGKDIILERLVL